MPPQKVRNKPRENWADLASDKLFWMVGMASCLVAPHPRIRPPSASDNLSPFPDREEKCPMLSRKQHHALRSMVLRGTAPNPNSRSGGCQRTKHYSLTVFIIRSFS